ncbi:hypothetical protein ACP70R_036962 [Stipagrostis hirtigluma subsp. patula]
MGNYASCTMATAAAGSGSGARVVLPDGRVRHVALPAAAAELMLESPGHFLADARALRPGRRIEALAADAELERGVTYAALPMKRLGAPVAPADDVARLADAVLASEEKARQRRSKSSSSSAAATAKVTPVVAPLELLSDTAEEDERKPTVPRLDEMEVDDAAAAMAARLEAMEVDDAAATAKIEELKQRLSSSGRRSRRPSRAVLGPVRAVPRHKASKIQGPQIRLKRK